MSPSTATPLQLRNEIAELVLRFMRGPFGGEEEILTEPPQRFYVTGILFPQPFSSPEDGLTAEESGDPIEGIFAPADGVDDEDPQPAGPERGSWSSDDGADTDRDLNLSTEFRPSSFGLSVISADGEASFKIRISYGRYIRRKGRDIPEKEDLSEHTFPKDKADNEGPDDAATGPDAGAAATQYRRIPEEQEYSLSFTASGFELADAAGQPVSSEDPEAGFSKAYPVDDHGLILRVTRRRTHSTGGTIFTVALVNASQPHAAGRAAEKLFVMDCRNYYFQPEIELVAGDYLFSPGPEDSLPGTGDSAEDAGRKLLFRNYRSYGAGHGAAASWEKEDVDLELGRARRVKAVVIPQYDVLPVDFDLTTAHRDGDIILAREQQQILQMKRLAGMTGESPASLEGQLRAFVARYADWIDQQRKRITALAPEFKTAATASMQKCDTLLLRMIKGIDLLFDRRKNPDGDILLQAFQDANRAMFMQRVMKEFADKRVKADYLPGPHDEAIPDFAKEDATKGRWRPFQLAFLLSQVEGILDPGSEDRETVDLIWFSTGGGKTEAYLGLTAFSIFFRRLWAARKEGSPDLGAGVSVLMRYTLRLLNIQQFNRASILICACELMRREQPQVYGTAEFSTGIWVGGALTPNRTGPPEKERTALGAIAQYNLWLDNGNNKPDLSPPLSHCPCCGTRIVPDRRNGIRVGEWGYFQKHQPQFGPGQPPGGAAVAIADSPVFLSCRNSLCAYYIATKDYTNQALVEARKLPVYYVDDVIYNRRPSLLFATVDKFAQLAWKAETGRLFNLDRSEDGRTVRAFTSPDLIIQDELHLISSALGTMYGVYEFAIDELCSWNGAPRPKIVGASATVRNAESQCRQLYNRRHFAQFPPQGIDADDSFFSRLNTRAPGRRYLGIMPAGRTATINIIYLTGRAMQLIPRLEYDNSTMDWYYTMLVYFNSIKELGKFRTLMTDDIAAHRYGMNRTFRTLNATSLFIPFRDSRMAELSSAMTADQIYQYLNRLENSKLPPDPETTRTTADQTSVELLATLGVRSAQDIRGNKRWRKVFTDEVLQALGINPAGQEHVPLFEALHGKLTQLFGNRLEEPIHVAAATNMISVGVDIARLNVMQIAGQPKSTAEYIQASSRAGREQPGLVMTSYNNAKSRDRSHYESFTDYHQAFYKHVESNSVTPYSLPALEKALPSVLIALMRLLYFRADGRAWWPSDHNGTGAGIFFDEMVNRLKKRIYHPEGITADLEANVDQVATQLKQLWNGLSDNPNPGYNLRFAENVHFFPQLRPDDIDLDLFVSHSYDPERRYGRPAVNSSLRNVEASSSLLINY